MAKYFIGFLVIFAIIGIGYRLSVKKDVAVDLVTFTNDELGFTLKYEPNSKVKIGDAIVIPEGASALDVMVESTILDGSGLNPKPESFVKEITKNTTVYYVKSGQFEGQVSYDGYFHKDNFIIPIHYVWGNVDWTNPNYDSTKDPEFMKFMDILRSVEFIHQEAGVYEGLKK